MKRVGYLYEKIFSTENVKAAIFEAARNRKTKRKNVRQRLLHADSVANAIIKNPHVSGKYKEIARIDLSSGKERHIKVPPFYPDQIIHHAVIRVINPLLERSYYKWSCSCIKGRGQVYASNHLRKVVRTDPKNTKYFVKLDIRKYYDHVNHDLLKTELNKHIKDDMVNALLSEIIDTTPSGLPIGNYTSQIFANVFLDPVDHFVKERIGVPHYIRFADDMVLLDGNRRRLAKSVCALKAFLRDIGLETHGNEQIKSLSHKTFIDFCGFRHYRDHATIRRRIFKRLRRTVLRIANLCLKSAQRLMAYWGYVVHTNSKYFIKKYITHINFAEIKKAISQGERQNGLSIA